MTDLQLPKPNETMAAGAFTVDEADFGFCQVTEEKLWEVEELYVGNIAMLKDFVSQLADFGSVLVRTVSRRVY